MTDFTYPHVDIDIQAEPKASTTTSSVAQPLHCPFFFITAEKGPVNVPYEGTFDEIEDVFGSRSFDPTGPYWTHQNLFAMAAGNGGKITVIRLADNSATAASLVVELTVTASTDIPVYKTDTLGNRVVDDNGAYVQDTNTDGTPKTTAGFTAAWSVRALKSGESYDTLGKSVLATDASQNATSVKFPILAFAAADAGAGPNRDGVLLYSNRSVGSAVPSSSVASAWLRFAPIQYAYGSSVYTNVVDTESQTYNDVSFANAAISPITTIDHALASVLTTFYEDSNGNSLLEFNTEVYTSFYAEAVAMIFGTSLPEADAYSVDLMSGLSSEGLFYPTLEVDAASLTTANLDSSLVPAMLSGGTDGALGNTAFETMLSSWISGGGSDEFLNNFKYPFTHFYDSGFSTSVKYAMVNLLNLRDDIKGDWSTQDQSQPLNTQAEDYSVGAALMTRLQTNPESVLYGTKAMRASIYMQAGVLASGSIYGKVVPATYARMLKRVSTDSGSSVNGSIKGRPGSEVTVFKKLNWEGATPLQKQTNWDAGLNAICSANRSVRFYPDLRSIYSDQTSLLSDDIMVDRLIYIKHIARDVWTYYAGREDPPKTLWPQIEKDINDRIGIAFNSALQVDVTVTQSELDQLKGYATTIIIAVKGNSPMRVWNVRVPVSKASTSTSTTS